MMASSLSLSIVCVIFVLFPLFSNASHLSDSRDNLNLILFDTETLEEYGSRCLDGSPAGFYYRPSLTAQSKSKFIIFLQGGADCNDEASCINRSKTDLGSSNSWATTRTQQFTDNILTSDSSANQFWDWNFIWVPYCSGDLYLGTNNQPSNVSWGLYFTGHLIVEATINTLANKYGMNQATEVIVSGDSAGGIGTFYHIDFISAFMANITSGQARVVGTPQAGWFSVANIFTDWIANPSAPFVPKAWQPYFTHTVVQMWNPSEKCLSATSSDKQYLCTFVPYLYSFINTPLFVAENGFDSYQVFEENKAPIALLNSTVQSYIKYFGVQMKSSINNNIVQGKQSNGLFLTPCLEHELHYSGLLAPKINGVTYAQAFAQWYNQTNPQGEFYIAQDQYPTCFYVD